MACSCRSVQRKIKGKPQTPKNAETFTKTEKLNNKQRPTSKQNKKEKKKNTHKPQTNISQSVPDPKQKQKKEDEKQNQNKKREQFPFLLLCVLCYEKQVCIKFRFSPFSFPVLLPRATAELVEFSSIGEDDESNLGVAEHRKFVRLLEKAISSLSEGHLPVDLVLNPLQLNPTSPHFLRKNEEKNKRKSLQLSLRPNNNKHKMQNRFFLTPQLNSTQILSSPYLYLCTLSHPQKKTSETNKINFFLKK